MANRHFSRIQTIQALYEWDFRKKEDINKILARNIQESQARDVDLKFVKNILKGVVEKQEEIDQVITKSAPEWPIEQIAIIDKTILRLAIFELLYNKDEVPPKVAIDEAVELAKSFGGDNSSKFVNGVLGAVFRKSPKYDPKEDTKKIREDNELKAIPKIEDEPNESKNPVSQ